MKTAPPQKPLTHWPPYRYQSRVKVALTEASKSWAALAKTFGRHDPWDIIVYNFETHVPEIVNHYMAALIGCTKSNDGLNYSFSPDDKPGYIYIPPREWKPAMGPYQTDLNRYEESVLSALATLKVHGTPYLNPAGVRDLVKEKIYVEHFDKLDSPCEYAFGDKLFVRGLMSDFTDTAWLIKEAVHIWNGPHGWHSGTYLENETAGWIALAAWWDSMFSGPGAVRFRAYFATIYAREGRAEKVAAFNEALNHWHQLQWHRQTGGAKPSAAKLQTLIRRDPSFARRNHLHNLRRKPQAS
ncbi:MAG: hypothetical protein IT162_01005 [Bryobacterales bacterium]|nr:hypothetical protein [Bryobacterales bacterium]